MRVLFVCTHNICRSRMAEDVFRVLTWSVPGRGSRHEARSAGIQAQPGARPLTLEDLEWADLVCVMEEAHRQHIRTRFLEHDAKVRVLGIPDVYLPGDPVLRDLLATRILSLLADAPSAGPGTPVPSLG